MSAKYHDIEFTRFFSHIGFTSMLGPYTYNYVHAYGNAPVNQGCLA